MAKKKWEELKEILEKARKEQVNLEVIKGYEEKLQQAKEEQKEWEGKKKKKREE
jgi:hypothetical protein